ncbi:hypothetical protein CVD25_13505 [Bacillus canaveralius]|uniref:Uncharacterized protein n=1 Tax=Bacillus canaveralius TaxID=1403243 RepID=A0ABX4T5M7_9BACI|nr:hypothetical protein CVD25_13505 [Bacillus canaveralius]
MTCLYTERVHSGIIIPECFFMKRGIHPLHSPYLEVPKLITIVAEKFLVTCKISSFLTPFKKFYEIIIPMVEKLFTIQRFKIKESDD